MEKKKVLVCGTNYGHAYVKALACGTHDVALSGILARGSERSRQCAAENGVPLYRSVEEVPSDIDLACVAVKSSIQGGEGTKIARALMARGIHVLQEHPVHAGELATCLDDARAHGVVYHVNSHFVHLEPVRVFIHRIQAAVEHERPLFIEATTSLSYSLMAILQRALGTLKPFDFAEPGSWGTTLPPLFAHGFSPFGSTRGVVGGVPVHLTMQTAFDPGSDLDTHLLVMHRICVGMPSGNLQLVNTHGPVVWTGHCPLDLKGAGSVHGTAGHVPTSVLCSEEPCPSMHEVVEEAWPRAIHMALGQMNEEIASGIPSPGQSASELLEISDAWMQLTRQFGNPELTYFPEPSPTFPAPPECRRASFAG
ncbi:Gfo/Idh/MocA family oxidoreductase [Desulfoluna spongiiphila]|uniref:Gfo/Idh/MocA family oxidoreductase n=1 Tax=Desulfoluna spongiiphila TaxID=419481 RepID=UPI001251DEDB|nr:Gfo/Idh/MocA family oxidoreductase [Desulfoluna spongiiphila]VVS94554.1 thiazolinyl imide reductase [Desulfoluna spongiiphila]